MSKLRSAIFYLKKPSYWPHFQQKLLKPFRPDLDTHAHRAKAVHWARRRALPLADALAQLGIVADPGAPLPVISDRLMRQAMEQVRQSGCAMGGPGYIELIYAAARLTGARHAIETGVAYGWSSLAFLAAMQETNGRLISVDRPYPGARNEPFVGIAVPNELRKNWLIVREPDRHGLRKAVTGFPDGIDIAHYDSDKSYRGRMYAYPILWNALRPGGIFISDDIQDNMAFAAFVDARRLSFAVSTAGGKYVGIAIKPGVREGARATGPIAPPRHPPEPGPR
jgi:predicted O-methyltransferase YrrM